MPTETPLPVADADPAPPAGYRAPYRFEYPQVWLNLAVVVASALFVPALLWVAVKIQGGVSVGSVLNIDGTANIVRVILICVATIVIHELVHGGLMRFLGYRPRYGFSLKMLAAYAIAERQYITRMHNLIIALGPLVLMNGAILPLLFSKNLIAVSTAFFVILVNSMGAFGDLYISWRLIRMPPGTLLYDVSEKRMLVFEPRAE